MMDNILMKVELDDGEKITIKKHGEYTEDSPKLVIVYTHADGESEEQSVNPKKISPAYATEGELMALNAYLVLVGLAKSDYSPYVIRGTHLDMEKHDYMAYIREIMMNFYNDHKIKEYWAYNKIITVYADFAGLNK